MRRAKTGPILLVILLNIVLATSCATLTQQRTQRIPITSSPIGATVIVNGQQQGVTPLDIRLVRKTKGPVIRIESPGYNPVEIRPQRKMSTNAIIGNIFLSAITGFASGAFSWWVSGRAIFVDPNKTDYLVGILGGIFSFVLYEGVDSKNKGREWKPAELIVTLTKADETPRVDTILINADDLQNIKWIRVRRD